MSINWVTVENRKPLELPGETFHFDKIGVNIELWHNQPVPGQTSTTKIQSNHGTIYLTNKRIVFLPENSNTFSIVGRGDREFKSFACDLLKMYQCKLVQPWFGPNYWQSDIIPVKDNGGLEPDSEVWKLKVIFKEGGAFDFTSCFDNLQSQLRQLTQDGLGEALPEYSEF